MFASRMTAWALIVVMGLAVTGSQGQTVVGPGGVTIRPAGAAVSELLGPLGYDETMALAVNEQGWAAGYSFYGETTVATLWTGKGVTELGTLGGPTSIAYGINKTGLVVGQAETDMVVPAGGLVSQAFKWEDGQMYTLPTPPGRSSAAYGVNDGRAVVGWYETEDGDQHAALWPETYIAEALIDLGTLGGAHSFAYAINFDGLIVGQADTEVFNPDRPVSKPFVYFQPDGMQTLPVLPGGVSGAAFDVNDAGVIVGWTESADSDQIAVAWFDEDPVSLGTLGGAESVANAVNERGWIVGMSFTAVDDESAPGCFELSEHAFLWRNGRMIDLNELLPPRCGWELITATGINDRGEVTGYGMCNGTFRGFVMTLGNTAKSVGDGRIRK